MVKKRKKPQDCNCHDCGKDTWNHKDQYMLHAHVWAQFGVGKGYLCIACLTKRMGRSLRFSDFSGAPINEENYVVQITKLSSITKDL